MIVLDLSQGRPSPDIRSSHQADDIAERNSVRAYFHSGGSYWGELYDGTDPYRRTYVQRKDAVLDIVDRLVLRPDSQLFEIGCGPGIITVALARRGYNVAAADLVFDTVQAAVRRAGEAGEDIDRRVQPSVADANRLPFLDESFDLVLAIGVSEWLPNLSPALCEIARVVKPGGFVIVSTDNRWALHGFLDPLLNPIMVPIKEVFVSLLSRTRLRGSRVRPKTYSIHQFDLAVREAGLKKLFGRTLGFEPFSFFRQRILPDSASFRIHRALQRLADRRVPVVQSAGRVYLLLATKGNG